MQSFPLVASLFLVISSLKADSDLEGQLHAKLQPLLDDFALRYNTSFAVGFQNAVARVGVAAGVNDHAKGTRVNIDSLYPSGSTTKTWTALGVMQLIQKGVLHLNDTVAVHIDAYLAKNQDTTLQELWGGDATISTITIEQLLSMRAGLQDYDNDKLESYTLMHPEQDVSPYGMIEQFTNKTFLCTPGTCGAYTSINYEILGLLLAAKLAPDGDWLDFDQLSVLPGKLRPKFNRTLFPKLGKCSTYGSIGVVHQYAVDASKYQWGQISWFDMMPFSCLNGWTCGNIAAAPVDLASFYYHLLNGKGDLLDPLLVAKMTKTNLLDKGWSTGLPYGLGLMKWSGKFGFKTIDPSQSSQADLIGHGGEDWGSNALISGYNSYLDFGISLATNSVTGMNCSLSNMNENFQVGGIVVCEVYKAVLEAVGQAEGRSVPQLDCGSTNDQLLWSRLKSGEMSSSVRCPWSAGTEKEGMDVRAKSNGGRAIYV
jgi:CubicO group peptidase (beta-lactamase class C family)